VLWLPPYHPDINPIEEAWGIAKDHVGLENDGSQPFDQVKNLLLEGFEKVDWRPLVRRVHEHEERYLKRYEITQPEIGDIIDLDTSSSSEGEEEKGRRKRRRGRRRRRRRTRIDLLDAVKDYSLATTPSLT